MRCHLPTKCLLGVLLVCGLHAPARADFVYTQPSNFPGGTVFASQNDTASGGRGLFAVSYDNFTLATTTLITDVHWQGGFFNPGTQATITGFTLTFWENSLSNTPGSALLAEHIAGNANETFVGNQAFGPIFDYSTLLPSAFTANAGTTYWLSIVPDMAFRPQWGWHTGTGGDGRMVQDFSGIRSVNPTDFAFSLTGGVSVPEPSSLLLLVGGGICGLGFGLRRRWLKK